MAKYFFDLHEDDKSFIDDEGFDLNDEEAARLEAQRFLGDLAREKIRFANDRRTYVVVVKNENGRSLYSATLSYAGVRLAD